MRRLLLCAPLLLLGCGYPQDWPKMRGNYESAASKNRELAKEVERLNAEVEKLEAENKALRAEVKRLRDELDALRKGGGVRPTGKGGAR